MGTRGGARPGAGRPKGTPNKQLIGIDRRIKEMMQKHFGIEDYDPLLGVCCRIYGRPLGTPEDVDIKTIPHVSEDEKARIELKLCDFFHPKRKPVDSKGDDGAEMEEKKVELLGRILGVIVSSPRASASTDYAKPVDTTDNGPEDNT